VRGRLALVVTPAVAVGLVGCGNSSEYSADATLRCLQHRDEYSRTFPGPGPLKHRTINAFAHSPDETVISLDHAGLTGTTVSVRFQGPGDPLMKFDTADIYFFERNGLAERFYDARVKPQPPADRERVREEIQRRRNAVVWWTPPMPSAESRAILFDCLS
jgi:hypothetical protein